MIGYSPEKLRNYIEDYFNRTPDPFDKGNPLLFHKFSEADIVDDYIALATKTFYDVFGRPVVVRSYIDLKKEVIGTIFENEIRSSAVFGKSSNIENPIFTIDQLKYLNYDSLINEWETFASSLLRVGDYAVVSSEESSRFGEFGKITKIPRFNTYELEFASGYELFTRDWLQSGFSTFAKGNSFHELFSTLAKAKELTSSDSESNINGADLKGVIEKISSLLENNFIVQPGSLIELPNEEEEDDQW